jgi:hypothetical protein
MHFAELSEAKKYSQYLVIFQKVKPRYLPSIFIEKNFVTYRHVLHHRHFTSMFAEKIIITNWPRLSKCIKLIDPLLGDEKFHQTWLQYQYKVSLNCVKENGKQIMIMHK